MENYYTALNYTDTLGNDNDHIMIKIQLHGEKESVTINAMIDSQATEDFIDREVCNKHGIKMIKAIFGTRIAIRQPHNAYGRIVPRSSLAVKHRLTTHAGVIDSDYRGEVKVVVANLGDQPYRVEKGDRIAQLIIEQIDNRELQEVPQLDDTEREDEGFGSSNTTMNQRVKGQKAKPKVEINEIWARAFGQF